ncbi:MAG TPA: hypothetical protein ENJ95_03560 [Bacteroidetes bacterium]|nr:hypothetical protein [Bacteroidota bacterium]
MKIELWHRKQLWVDGKHVVNVPAHLYSEVIEAFSLNGGMRWTRGHDAFEAAGNEEQRKALNLALKNILRDIFFAQQLSNL